jgi:hypothetical protein
MFNITILMPAFYKYEWKKKKVLQNLVRGLEGKKYFLEIRVDGIMTPKINHTEKGRHKER